MCTINTLSHVKPDLVRIDADWEEWKMSNLIDCLQKLLRRNKVEDSNTKQTSDPRRKRENSLFTQRKDNENNKGKKIPCCIFCKSEHWSDTCESCVTTVQTKTYFTENKLCFNGRSPGHMARHCRSRVAITVERNIIPVYMILKTKRTVTQYLQAIQTQTKKLPYPR